MLDISALPRTIHSGSYPYGHCQGIAVDTEKRCVYYSFTTALVKTDFDGNFLGSVVGLLGHLGCIVRRPSDGFIYGSLEYKNDAIGRGILNMTGKASIQNAFYIAVFDGDKITRADMDAEGDGIMCAAFLKPVTDDYLGVTTDSREHILGCSGIDGTAIGPMPGSDDGKEWLFVAYGVYSDVERDDNDHQVLLRFDPDDIRANAAPLSQSAMHDRGCDMAYEKYFAYTGNTTYGVQNLEYDPVRKQYLMAVYCGKKPAFPNLPMYMIDAARAPEYTELSGLSEKGNRFFLAEGNVRDGKTGLSGSDYPGGSTGLAALGADENGVPYYYVSYHAHGTDGWSTDVRLCRGDETKWIVPLEEN